ncbi:hypothetical protein DSECCO2_557530 [anaerobic digester metagenome]
MTDQSSNYQNPIPFSLISENGLSFIFWAYSVNTANELEYATTYYNRGVSAIAINNISVFDSKFVFRSYIPTEIACIGSSGVVLNISKLDDKNISLASETSVVLLIKMGLCELYGVSAGQTSIKNTKDTTSISACRRTETIDPESLSAVELSEIILSERDGINLRSSIPTVYVWYNHLLFIVNRIAFPPYSASRDMAQNVKAAVEILVSKGINPMLREAVYPSKYHSDNSKISAYDTWWGMENTGKFKTR